MNTFIEKDRCWGCLDVHHIKNRVKGGNDKEWLITGCRKHHDKWESMRDDKSIKLLTSLLTVIYNYQYE